MKLRLVSQNGKRILCCPNGSIMLADDSVLQRLLTSFDSPSKFMGKDGCWNATVCEMEDVKGTTPAAVDDKLRLIIYSPKAFADFETSRVYVSASEYAEIHNKSHPQIKKLCEAGRIKGAQSTRGGWIIPKDAPYPERQPREVKTK